MPLRTSSWEQMQYQQQAASLAQADAHQRMGMLQAAQHHEREYEQALYQHAHEMNVEVRASIREGLRDGSLFPRFCSRAFRVLFVFLFSDFRDFSFSFSLALWTDVTNKIGLLSAIMTIDALLVSSSPAFLPRFAHIVAHTFAHFSLTLSLTLLLTFRPHFAHVLRFGAARGCADACRRGLHARGR
jgi:hypothetical protein